MTRRWGSKSRGLTILAVLLFLSALAGCSRSTGTVYGKVTIGGQPLNVGTVTFVPEDGQAQTCSIEPDGGYSVSKVPIGPCTIAVTSGQPSRGMWNLQTRQPAEGGVPPGQPPPFIRIPPRYNDPQQSGLTYDVPAGRQLHDIELKP